MDEPARTEVVNTRLIVTVVPHHNPPVLLWCLALPFLAVYHIARGVWRAVQGREREPVRATTRHQRRVAGGRCIDCGTPRNAEHKEDCAWR